jgi:hypothetical protein
MVYAQHIPQVQERVGEVQDAGDGAADDRLAGGSSRSTTGEESPMRILFVLVAAAALLAIPTASATQVVSANGSAHWTIPLPNAFGIEVVNRTLSFNARTNADGEVEGRFEYHQVAEGQAFTFNVAVTCLQVYDGNRAKLGGVIEVSNDPTVPAGTFAWFQVFDNGEGAEASPDRSSLIGFGDEAANEAFCNSPNLPRFGPWDVAGNVQVRG